MQITLLRHGKYEKSIGHLTDEGINDTVTAGLSLGNAVVKKLIDIVYCGAEYHNDSLIPVSFLSEEYQEPIQAPDLILTSPSLRAKETGFAFAEQLKNAGIVTEIRNNIAYLNDLDLISNDYKLNHHNYIDEETAKKMTSLPPIQKTVDLIKRLEKEGKKHVVIVSHQPNIHVLLNLLSKEPKIALKAPENSVIYTVLSVDAENIGREKYPTQMRWIKSFDLKRAYSLAFSVAGIYVPSAEDIKWKMPDYMYMDILASKKNERNNGKSRV